MANIKEINDSEAKVCFLIDSVTTNLWSFTQWKAALNNKNARALGIYVGDKLVGVCVFQLNFDEAELHFMAILSDFTRRGFGSMLFTKFLYVLENNNIRKVLLEVSSRNLSAIKFYEKFNFTTVGIRKNYYKDGTDTILKTKVIC